MGTFLGLGGLLLFQARPREGTFWFYEDKSNGRLQVLADGLDALSSKVFPTKSELQHLIEENHTLALPQMK